MASMRIAFVIGGDDLHHVPQVASIAQSLAESRPDWQIFFATLTHRAARDVRKVQAQYAPAPVHLRLRPSMAWPGGSIDRDAVLHEAEVLPSFDLIVVTHAERAVGYGKRILLCPNGGDHDLPRASGEAFERILVAGEKTRIRLIGEAGMPADRIRITGSPIFDRPTPPIRLWPDDGRRTVIYNPHWSPRLSSWFRWGAALLEWFADHPDYRLILAPHPYLFEQRFVRPAGRWFPRRVYRPGVRYLQAPNIHADLSSSLLATRAYLECADIYLGDANSQLYDFLARPRPCGFLNAHGMLGPADPRLISWRAGHVIDDLGDLGEMLRVAAEWHPDIYRPAQEQLFAASIAMGDTPAAERAARAIVDCLEPGVPYARTLELGRS